MTTVEVARSESEKKIIWQIAVEKSGLLLVAGLELYWWAIGVTFLNLSYYIWLFQAQEWIHAVVLPQEGPLPPRWLLLEETQGRQDHTRGPHEAESSGDGGKSVVS